MSGPRSYGPGGQDTQPYEGRPRGSQTQAPSQAGRGRRPGLGKLLTGIGLCVAVLLFGELVKSGAVARFDLRVDQHIAAHDRTSTLTSLAKLATDIAIPETVGVALLFLVPVILFLMRRRLDALKVFCMIGGTYALVEVVKKIVSEPRPPAAVQAVPADPSGSFPSGHAAVASVLCVALVVIAVTLAGRVTALVLGGLYTVAVACSRFYLGDHYPLDVLGSVLCALAAAFVVTGLAALPALQPRLRRLETAPARPRRRGPRA
ncbi:MAG TPA: phosphatase PAP2 family protein [Trebonia sp.]|nr:phosphatase PAP2 family protein [Trebonia sp.]